MFDRTLNSLAVFSNVFVSTARKRVVFRKNFFRIVLSLETLLSLCSLLFNLEKASTNLKKPKTFSKIRRKDLTDFVVLNFASHKLI